MAEHLIRFRGGWTIRHDGTPSPLALPFVWPSGFTQCVELVRRFHRPPLDPRRDALFLRLEHVGGLVVARLNGREIARPMGGASSLLVSLDQELPARNELSLLVERGPAPEPAVGASLWGEIALVIRSAGG